MSGACYLSYETCLAVRNYLSLQYLISTSPSHYHAIVIGTSYVFLNICIVLYYNLFSWDDLVNAIFNDVIIATHAKKNLYICYYIKLSF